MARPSYQRPYTLLPFALPDPHTYTLSSHSLSTWLLNLWQEEGSQVCDLLVFHLVLATNIQMIMIQVSNS